MPGLLSRMFRRKAASIAKKSSRKLNSETSLNGHIVQPQLDVWEQPTVRREDVVELLKACCDELKSRALDNPLFLLPFRPSSDLTSTKTFIRRYFEGGRANLRGDALLKELQLTDILVLAGVLRWVWTRLQGGIVGWEVYELFSKAEKDCDYAQHAFSQLMPLSVGSELHTAIILDFFGFLASVAAHAKSNGFNGQRLARICGWYAFEIQGSPDGFTDGYSNWERAANATEHLFLAYLRSIAPAPGQISAVLPISLTTLLKQAKYPPRSISTDPKAPNALPILRITLSVRNVSPTPFALLDRLARHTFIQTNPDEAGDALEAIIDANSAHNDPTKALTTECLRVLKLISATNESDVLTAALLRTPQSLEDKTWTRFADLGFEGLDSEDSEDESSEYSRGGSPETGRVRRRENNGIARPKTPSWGDFLVTGFGNQGGGAGFSLPPDKLLPPINATTLPSTTSRRSVTSRDGPGGYKSNLHELEKGEVKSLERGRVDDALWSVWMSSLCGEEVEEKKAVFGRCVIAETDAHDQSRRWIVVEEIVKGADVTPELNPPTKGKQKLLSKKSKKSAAEEQTLNKRAQQRRSTSDLISRHREQDGSLIGREIRAQALAKQSASLRTINEKPDRSASEHTTLQRRRSTEYNGRPSIMLGAEVSRAMRWAEGFDPVKPVKSNVEKPQPVPEKSLPQPQPQVQKQVQPVPQPQPKPQAPKPEPKSEIIEEIPREPKVAPKVQIPLQIPRSKTPEPAAPMKGPVLLPPDDKGSEKLKAPPTNAIKKLFGGKSKEEKAAKRASKAGPPAPPSSPPTEVSKVQVPTPPPAISQPHRAPSPSVKVREWEEDFDGTHRQESVRSPTPPKEVFAKPAVTEDYRAKAEEYRAMTPPVVPIVPRSETPIRRSETPTRDRTSEDDERDRWAQIRKAAGQRALQRAVAPPKNNSSDEITEVNVPRVRQNAGTPPRKVSNTLKEEEEEESVDARVARIRKRVQELTAGMGDD